MEVRPGYKRTEVGIIPEDWAVNSLVHYWNVTDCKHVTAQFVTNGYPIASIRETQSRFIDLADAKQTTHQFYRLLTEGVRKPRGGDLILSRNATVGEVAQVAEWHPPFAMGQDVCLLRKRSLEFSTEFLQEIFRSPTIASQLSGLMVGSTFKRANVQQIKSLIVPMPPPAEQKAIAEALSDADVLIESLEKLLAKKRHIKQGAMQELLTGKKRLPGFSGEWELKQIGELGRWIGGMTPSMRMPDYWQPATVPWISSGDVKSVRMTATAFSISEYAVKQRATTFVPANSIIVVARSGILRKRLPVAINMVPMAINQDIKALLPNCDVSTEYVLHALTCYGDLILARCLKSGTTVESIEFPWLKAFTIPIPPLPEQTAIAAVLSDMDAEITMLEGNLAKCRRLKQGMMHELLTGRIRLA
jgi:type I restriction enzyme, S subunit